MSQSLTLYDLEKRLVELMDLWSDTELEQDHRDQIALEIKSYLEAEISKVDGIRAYLRHCEVIELALREEATAQLERAKHWKARRERLKEYCVDVMGMIGATKLEGRTGILAVKGNGGKQPVTITDESMVPDEFCELTITVNKATWAAFRERLEADSSTRLALSALIASESFRGKSEPRKSLIEAELQKPCETCGGSGDKERSGDQACLSCRMGKRGVPGCRLEPRGSHLEIK